MLHKKNYRLYNLLFFILLSTPVITVKAEVTSQVHIWGGMITGSFSGVKSNTFSVVNGLNAEFEIFGSSTKSIFFKGVVALNGETGKMEYMGAFFGNRFYIFSTGMVFERTDNENLVISKPKWRFFAGWDFGISQIILEEVGPALTVISTLIDVGGHVGAIYQISKNWGFEGKFGYSFGYGFSTVAVSGSVMSALGGVSFFW